MEEEEDAVSSLLGLFDLCWFRHLVLRSPLPPSPPLKPPKASSSPLLLDYLDHDETVSHASEPQPFSRPSIYRRRHRRSLSDEASSSTVSSDLVIRPPKLQTILSGKVPPPEELAAENQSFNFNATSSDFTGQYRRRSLSNSSRRRKRKEEKSKSLTDLEFEELKGFMDLGFTFSDSETDPRLMEIVPGLQRLGRRKPEAEAGEAPPDVEEEHPVVARPYLSEAWEAAELAEEEEPLRNWRIPPAGDGVDLKDHLRFWARAVASTVR